MYKVLGPVLALLVLIVAVNGLQATTNIRSVRDSLGDATIQPYIVLEVQPSGSIPFAGLTTPEGTCFASTYSTSTTTFYRLNVWKNHTWTYYSTGS